jgi:hypothetical protein
MMTAMRRILLIRMAAAIAAVCVVTVPAPAASAASAGRVPVVRCPTESPISDGEVGKPPPSLTVLHSPSSTHGLVAYTNLEEFLIGPAGMQCSGAVGADGNGQISVWPHGLKTLSNHSKSEGLTLTFIPACVGCKAGVACPFFSQFATEENLPCPTGIPEGEHVYGLTIDATLFDDPPGIAGSGWPSGGPYAANGIVGVGSAPAHVVFRSTCTLPASQRWVCTVSLNDVLSRYGQPT